MADEIKKPKAAEAPKADGKTDAPKRGERPAGGKKFTRGGRRPDNRPERPVEEFEQRMVDIARVTRVMAGGKRMRFRACVAIGNKKGRVGIGLAKGADVTLAVQKAVNKAKKEMIEVPTINDTIPHEITEKFKAAKVLLKPAKKGKGVIAGGTARIILELAGIKNVYSKNLGTSNKLTVAKCVASALSKLKKVDAKKKEVNEDAVKPEVAAEEKK